jgi:hypothetical protein
MSRSIEAERGETHANSPSGKLNLMEFSMKTSAITVATVCAFLAAAPALAQDTVTGAPAGTAPVTVEGYGYGPGQPGFTGYNGYQPAYDNGWGPFGPVGAIAAGFGAVGSGMVGPTGVAVGGPMYATRLNPRCGVIHDFNGRYTSVCGP